MLKRLFFIVTLALAAISLQAASSTNVRPLQPKRIPVILANYSDVAFKSTDFNGYKESLERYFADNSFGQYTPVFDFMGPVTLSDKRSAYGANDEDGDDVAAELMIAQACNLAEDIADFTQYDQDGDGRIDALVVIYAGEGERMDNNLPEAVWEFTDDLETTYALDYLVQLDGKTVAACCAVPELQSKTKRDGIGTLVHEFAHILGLPNFGSTNGLTVKTLGDWSVMDHGCYNDNANTPAAFSAYERFYLGWVEPILLDGPMNVRLRDFYTTGDCAIITASGQSNLSGISPDPREFYILENRQQKGWDQYLPGHGLMLTKIDFVKNKWESDEVNNVERHPCVDIIEADGKAPKYKEDNLTNGYFGKQGDLFPSGATNYKMFSNKMWFDNVREQGGVISFDFNGGFDKCTVNFSVSSDKGTCATSTAKESSKGAGVTLPSVTAKSGYTFLGWSTRKNSNVADAGQPGEKFYPMCDCSVFAVMKDNTKFWLNYDLTGVEIGDYFDQYGQINYQHFNGAYIKVNAVQSFSISFKAKEGYAPLTPETCVVRVECGGKLLIDVAHFDADSLLVAVPASAITSDIYITIVNPREQKESGCDTYSHTFTGVCRVDEHANLSGYEWNVSIANDNTVDYDKYKGAVFGSGTYPASLVKLRTEETLGCGVALIRVSAAANGDGVLSVFVAGNRIGDAEDLYEQLETYEFELNEPVSGAVEVRLENTSKAMYLKQIEIYFDLLDDTQRVETIRNGQSSFNGNKRIVDGQLYIFHGGHIYNVTGAQIK